MQVVSSLILGRGLNWMSLLGRCEGEILVTFLYNVDFAASYLQVHFQDLDASQTVKPV